MSQLLGTLVGTWRKSNILSLVFCYYYGYIGHIKKLLNIGTPSTAGNTVFWSEGDQSSASHVGRWLQLLDWSFWLVQWVAVPPCELGCTQLFAQATAVTTHL